MPLFVHDHNGPMETQSRRMICNKLVEIRDLKIVSFDPLAAFAQVPLNSDSTAAQFVTSAFGQGRGRNRRVGDSRAPHEKVKGGASRHRGSTRGSPRLERHRRWRPLRLCPLAG